MAARRVSADADTAANDATRPNQPIRFEPRADDPLRADVRASTRTLASGPTEPPQRPQGPVRFGETPGGEEVVIPIGRWIGEGSISEVFAHAEDPNLAVRVTYLDEDLPAVIVDQYGDVVLRERVTSEHIRPVEVIDDFEIASGRFGGRRVSRVSIVELVDSTAWERIARQPSSGRYAYKSDR